MAGNTAQKRGKVPTIDISGGDVADATIGLYSAWYNRGEAGKNPHQVDQVPEAPNRTLVGYQPKDGELGPSTRSRKAFLEIETGQV